MVGIHMFIFTRLSRWLVICAFVFSVSGNASADRVTLTRLIASGYNIVGYSGDRYGMNVLLMKRDSVYHCYISNMDYSKDGCRSV